MLNFSVKEKNNLSVREKMDKSLEILKSLSPEELNTLRMTIESILFPESKPFSVDQEARDVRRGKRAREFPHCVHCGSDAIRGHGTYKHYRRYLCVSCKKTFTDITKTCIAHIQKRDQFRQYIVCMIHGMSLRKAAKQTGVCLKTAFDWRHKILHALKMNPHQQLRGVTEADETFFRYSEKGSRKLSRPPRKRGGGKGPGLDDELVCVLTAKDRSGSPPVIETVGRGPITSERIHEKLKGSFIDQNLLLCTDANNSYKKYCKEHNIKHKVLNLSKKQRVVEKHLHLQNVNATHSRLKGWMRRFHGVASKYLQNYMNYFRTLEEFKKSDNNCRDFFHNALLADCSFISTKNISQHFAIT